MGILTRIFNLFRATTSDLLDKAEDPKKMIKQMISDLEAQKKKAKEQMTEALAHQNNADSLKESYQTMEDKIDEIKRKQGLLSVKQKQAEAQEKIYKTIEGLGDTSGIMDTIERAEEKVENLQARAEAYQEISMESDQESLEKKFKELEHESPDMEMELLELKKRAALPVPEEKTE